MRTSFTKAIQYSIELKNNELKRVGCRNLCFERK